MPLRFPCKEQGFLPQTLGLDDGDSAAAGRAVGPRDQTRALQDPHSWRPSEATPILEPVAEINKDTVEALLDEVRDLLEAEDKRAQSLNARGSGLAAFVGLIVSLVGTVGRAPTSDLSECVRVPLAGLFIAAVVLLLLSFGAVLKVLLPSTGLTVKFDEVERYPTLGYVTQPKVMAQGRRMRGLVKALAKERDRNEEKARWLKWSYNLLGLGLLCVGAGGVILVADRLL